jgi:dihydrofolate reductase
LSTLKTINEIYIIGGSSLFELALGKYKNYCKMIVMTRINKVFECDVFMPKFDEEVFTKLYISKTYSENDITYDYCFYGNNDLMHK